MEVARPIQPAPRPSDRKRSIADLPGSETTARGRGQPPPGRTRPRAGVPARQLIKQSSPLAASRQAYKYINYGCDAIADGRQDTMQETRRIRPDHDLFAIRHYLTCQSIRREQARVWLSKEMPHRESPGSGFSKPMQVQPTPRMWNNSDPMPIDASHAKFGCAARLILRSPG